MKESVLAVKSFDFAVKVVDLYKYLVHDKNEYVLSKQILRSGTSVGAMISEAAYAESKADFIHKYGIAQKECFETIYWLRLLNSTGYIESQYFDQLLSYVEEIMKMLSSSIITAKKSIARNV